MSSQRPKVLKTLRFRETKEKFCPPERVFSKANCDCLCALADRGIYHGICSVMQILDCREKAAFWKGYFPLCVILWTSHLALSRHRALRYFFFFLPFSTLRFMGDTLRESQSPRAVHAEIIIAIYFRQTTHSCERGTFRPFNNSGALVPKFLFEKQMYLSHFLIKRKFHIFYRFSIIKFYHISVRIFKRSKNSK